MESCHWSKATSSRAIRAAKSQANPQQFCSIKPKTQQPHTRHQPAPEQCKFQFSQRSLVGKVKPPLSSEQRFHVSCPQSFLPANGEENLMKARIFAALCVALMGLTGCIKGERDFFYVTGPGTNEVFGFRLHSDGSLTALNSPNFTTG